MITKPPEGCIDLCPGCAHRHMSTTASIEQKENWCKEKLDPWKDVIAPICFNAEESERWHYRDKACLNAAELPGRWAFGMIRRKVLVEIPNCPIHRPRVNEIFNLFQKKIPLGVNFPLRYLAVTGQQVSLILKTKTMPALGWMDEELYNGLFANGVEGLWVHLNEGCNKRVFGNRNWHLIWGKERSRTAQGMFYGPKSFQQVLTGLSHKALDETQNFLRPSPESCVVDLYCGIGEGLRRWTLSGARTLGVELNGEAIDCAQQNVPNAVCLRGPCGDRVPQIREFVKESRECLVFANPPRIGMEEEVTQFLLADLKPKRMAYLSCSAGTLSKDLNRLTDLAFKVERIIPFDFFPQTYHVELLVFLSSLERSSR